MGDEQHPGPFSVWKLVLEIPYLGLHLLGDEELKRI